LLLPLSWCGALQPPMLIDISCPPGPQQQTRRTLLQRSIDGTDGRTPNRYMDPASSFGDVIQRQLVTPPAGTITVSSTN